MKKVRKGNRSFLFTKEVRLAALVRTSTGRREVSGPSRCTAASNTNKLIAFTTAYC